jgi:hypothetical protein
MDRYVVPVDTLFPFLPPFDIGYATPVQKPLMLKIRVEYNIGGTKVVDTATVSAFPPGL